MLVYQSISQRLKSTSISIWYLLALNYESDPLFSMDLTMITANNTIDISEDGFDESNSASQ